MPVYGQFPDKVVTLPAPGGAVTKPEVIALLRLHGIAFDALPGARTMTLDMVRLVGPELKEADEGHIPLGLPEAYAHALRRETFPPVR